MSNRLTSNFGGCFSRVPGLCLWWAIFICIGAGCSGKSKQGLVSEGAIELEKGNASAAIVLFKRALERDPNDAYTRHHLANAYMQSGNYVQAEKEFLKVRCQLPFNSSLRLELAKLYILMGKADKAAALADTTVKESPNHPAARATASKIPVNTGVEREWASRKSVNTASGKTTSEPEFAESFLFFGRICEFSKQPMVTAASTHLESIFAENVR